MKRIIKITFKKVKKVSRNTSMVTMEAVKFYEIKKLNYGRVSAQIKTDQMFGYAEGTMASYNGKKGAVTREKLRLERKKNGGMTNIEYKRYLKSLSDDEIKKREYEREQERLEEAKKYGWDPIY